MPPPARLKVRGAREHNLRSVDLDLPHDAIVAFTGVSGSGKSSLAFDTIYREAERRYLESFSAHTRRLLARLGRPQADSIEGLRPAMALAQHRSKPGSRSTVGTLSEIWSTLRLLFAKCGAATCHACGGPLEAIEEQALRVRLGERFGDRDDVRVLAPLVDDHAGAHRAALARLVALGCDRLWIDGGVLPTTDLPDLAPQARHTIAGVVDVRRAEAEAPRAGFERRVDRALRIADGVVWIEADGVERFSARRACRHCDAPAVPLGSRLFSFNSAFGACPACAGLGVEDVVDPDLLVADPSRTLREGALVPTTPSGYIVYSQVTLDVLDTVCRAHGFDVDTPWERLTDEQRHVVLHGSDRLEVPFGKHPLESRLKWKGITAKPRETGHYQGIVPTIAAILARTRNKNALRFARTAPCSSCDGTRLRVEARAVRLGEESIDGCAAMEVRGLRAFLGELRLDPERAGVAEPILRRLSEQLALLEELGLGYLTLARSGDSLSGGELQRVRLARQVAAQLTGMLYVLDEPSAGLHPSDRAHLYDLLARLRDAGGSVYVVEHDPTSAMRADWLVDVGPGAGEAGGRIDFSGAPCDLLHAPGSPETTRASFERAASADEARAPHGDGRVLRIVGASANNLRSIDVDFHLGCLNAVTGVSGAGKSSLVESVLVHAVRSHLDSGGSPDRSRPFERIEGLNAIRKIVAVDAEPIGRTPRSNPATYTGLFDDVRALFAALPAAKKAKLGKGHFSFNGKLGRCENCEGAGHETIPMHGLAPHLVPCGVCRGQRFRDAVLAVRWNDLTIRDVLDLSIEHARDAFGDHPKITRVLDTLIEIGVGYLTLGQPAPTLSGGEAQRVKLAKELARPADRGHTLYVLDEPSSGLAVRDVEVLTRALVRLADRGHTVVVVEHHRDLVMRADHVVDLGPGSGDDGGRVVAQGTPTEIAAASDHSATGRMLATADQPLVARPMPRDAQPPIATELRGVRTHNLRSVDATFPRGKLTVVTGVSGSGKSSLAFDTLYAAGRQRFLDGLPSHVRRRLPATGGGEFDSVSGLTASLAIDQRARRYGSRSTVGTITGILEDLRLLFARAGDDPDLDTARAFSFLDPAGACPACGGRGALRRCDPSAIVHDSTKSIGDGALAGSRAGRFYTEPNGQHLAILAAVGKSLGLDFSKPWSALDAHARDVAMHGLGETRQFEVVWRFERKGRRGEQELSAPWLGFCGYVDEEYARKSVDGRGQDLEPLLRDLDCAVCDGTRLAQRARAARFGDLTLPEWCALPATEFADRLRDVDDPVLTATGLGDRILRRAARMAESGIGYLSLERRARSLSAGEAQRVRLIGQWLGGLDGLTYVFDEPTLGLHAADVPRLVDTIRDLVRPDNRVVVVEHDLDVIAAADHVVEVGPGAGTAGGRIVHQGSVAELLAIPDSPTGRALERARRPLEFLPLGGPHATAGQIEIVGAKANNLRAVDCALPLGRLVAVTGVSGSGKSSLVFDVLGPSVERGVAVDCDRVEGLDEVRSVVTLAHGSLSASPNVTPATYLELLDPLQRVFSKSESAHELGLKPRAFSLSQKGGGRCEACQGAGRIREEIDFLGAVWLRCETCRGRRFGPEVRACTIDGLDLATLLESEVVAVRGWAETHAPKIVERLQTLIELGLGYLHLGQTADTLSGGEAQRLRLARELGSAEPGGGILFLLDEPSTGLHDADIVLLIAALRRLVAAGHTVVVVEHDLGVIASADLVLDLGPGPGEDGGRIVAACPPAELVQVADSATGRALARAQLGRSFDE